MIRILLFICCCSLVQDDPVMSWSNSYKLSWSDFKKEPNQKLSAVAITASGITFSFSMTQTDEKVVGFSTEVYAHFYPEKSWFKPERVNNYILGHEQLHFNITELHARKFRERISRLKVSNNIKDQLRLLQRGINLELKIMQDKYDAETDYSRNFDVQTKWEVYIAEELQKLSNYKSI